jgi:hypothetical protein
MIWGRFSSNVDSRTGTRPALDFFIFGTVNVKEPGICMHGSEIGGGSRDYWGEDCGSMITPAVPTVRMKGSFQS